MTICRTPRRCIAAYPGALHAFDALAPPHDFTGHHIGRDPAAAEDAIWMTRTFR